MPPRHPSRGSPAGSKAPEDGVRWPGIAALLLAFVTAGAARAETALDRYLGDRNRTVAELDREAAKPGNRGQPPGEHAALARLKAELGAAVGIQGPIGFPKGPELNLSGPFGGYLALDGLLYRSADGEGTALVTTVPLMRSWLADYRRRGAARPDYPGGVHAALRDSGFYFQAVGTLGAATAWYAPVPAAKPPGYGFVMAELGNIQQDDGPFLPKQLYVATVKGGRVSVAIVPVSEPVAPIPRCQRAWDRFEGEAAAARAAWAAGGGRQRAYLARQQRALSAGVDAYSRCFRRHAREQPWFPALVRQADDLVAGMPAKE